MTVTEASLILHEKSYPEFGGFLYYLTVGVDSLEHHAQTGVWSGTVYFALWDSVSFFSKNSALNTRS